MAVLEEEASTATFVQDTGLQSAFADLASEEVGCTGSKLRIASQAGRSSFDYSSSFVKVLVCFAGSKICLHCQQSLDSKELNLSSQGKHRLH